MMEFEDNTEWGIKQYELGEHSEELVEQKEAEKYWQAEGEKIQTEAEDQAAAEASDWEHHQIEELQRDCGEQAHQASALVQMALCQYALGDEAAAAASRGEAAGLLQRPGPRRPG